MVVFNRDDFSLCDVRVPKGYPQSQTHCGIIYTDGKYYLSTSPYPNPVHKKWWLYILLALRKVSFGLINPFYRGEDFENPLVYVADRFDNCGNAIGFKLLEGCPLMNKPIDKYGHGSYCSDPDLSFYNGYYYLINRVSYRRDHTGNAEVDYETHSYLIRGLIFNNKFEIRDISHLFEENDVSPCFRFFRGKMIYTSLKSSSYNNGKPCEGLYIRESENLTAGWSEKRSIIIEKGSYEPWHMSLFEYKNRLYAIVACVKQGEKQCCWQLLGEFNDDVTKLKIYQKPLTDYKSYRGSAVVTDSGMFIMYSTTMNERIKGGHSVDGREVIMAHKPFKEVLKELADNE